MKALMCLSLVLLVCYMPAPVLNGQPKSDEKATKASGLAIFGAEKPIPIYTFAELSVKVDKGDNILWEVNPEPKKLVEVDGRCFFSGPPGKKYTVSVYLVNFETKRLEKGKATVTFEGKSPDDEEDPEPDIEAATLTSQVKAAFKKDPEAERFLAASLAEVYRHAGEDLVGPSITWGNLFEAMAMKAESLKVNGKLLETQTVIQTYLMKHLPWRGVSETVMTKGDKTKAKNAFKTIASAVSKLSN